MMNFETLDNIVDSLPCGYGNDEGIEEYNAKVAKVSNIDALGKFKGVFEIRSFKEKEFKKLLVKANDLLVVKSSGSKSNILSGKTAICSGKEENKLIASNFLLRLRSKPEVSFPKYLWYILNSQYSKNFIKSIVGATTYPNLKWDLYSKHPIPLPSYETQKKIAAILDKAQTLINLDKQIIQKYDQLAQSVFLEMFGDPVANPKGFIFEKLVNLTNLITDGKHGNCNDEENSGYYFISAKDVFNGEIHYEKSRQIPKNEFQEVDNRTNLMPGDLIMVNTGATIGKMAIAKNIPETRRTTFQKSVAVIKPKIEKIDSIFLNYVFLLRLNTFANKGSGSAVKNLLLSEMRNFDIITPPINTQIKFSTIVKSIDNQKEIAQNSLKRNEKLFQSLLQKAFKGELIKEQNE